MRFFIFRRRIATLSLSTAAIAFATAGNSFAAGCLRDDRTVTFADGSTRMRSYVCKLANSEAPQVRVEFHRLSEAAAGSLLQNLEAPGVDTILGKPKILKTDVGAEAKKLFDEFGTKRRISNCFSFAIETPKGGKDYKKDYIGKDGCAERMLAFFSMPTGPHSEPMPLPDDNIYIKNKTAWPPNYSFFYTKELCTGEIECTVIWRPASISDINNYKQNLHRQNKLDKIPDADGTQDGEMTNLDKYFKLAKYLMRDGWQNDFMTVTGIYNACGGFNFNFYPRQLVLDVATIENISSAKINLDGLLATENAGGLMRKVKTAAAESEAVAKTVASPSELMPRGKALVPLRMTWSVYQEFRDIFPDLDAANRKYAQLRKKAPGTVFSVKDDNKIVLRKTRESFGEPSVPPMDDFVYGPSLDMTGLMVNGEKVLFAERSRNFLQATVINEEGSCPFLYAWHPETQSWMWYGKVIHKAKSKAREMTQEIPLTSFASRFRLSEEELELSHIDYVALKLELQDGTTHVLKPNNPVLSEVDEKYVRIPAGSFVEFGFTPPSGVEAAAVKRSTLTVKGYYEPYSSLNIGDNSDKPSIVPIEFRNR